MRIELHCHTNYSDGIPGVESVMKKAASVVDAIAITDHNTMKGYEKAGKMKKDLLLIPGVEVSASYGKKVAHVTVLGSEEVKFRKFMDVLELIDNAHSAGAVAINVHPFGGLFRPGFTEKEIVRKFDAVEVINGMTFNFLNRKAGKMADELKMRKVVGSDAHTLGLVGAYSCKINGDDVDDIIRAIKKGKVVIEEKRTNAARIFANQVSRKIYTKLRLQR